MTKYAFWNNKGGVGKTFLCFTAACQYALEHSETTVVVIDMCPQANVSEILLGGNGGGGSERLQILLNEEPSRTIGGYYYQRILHPHEALGREEDFLVRACGSNRNVPRNLYLVPGDPSLELQVQTINNISVQEIPSDAWRRVRSWVRDLQDALEREHGKCAFFIDCNPSFSSYTEQAILAADKLIVPCTADGSSVRAIENVDQLVYGRGVPDSYRDASFSGKARTFQMALPEPHLVVMNRSTTYRRRSAKAFATMYELVKSQVKKQGWADSSGAGEMFIEMPDAHTVAVVASHLGTPLHELRPGPYQLGDQGVQLAGGQLERHRKAIRDVVRRL